MITPRQRLEPESLQDSAQLRERLAAVSRGGALSGLVAVTNRNGFFFAGFPTEAAAGEDPSIRIGCLAKVLTATLASEAAREGLLPFESDARELRDVSGKPIFRALEGLNITHLLSHTHGLDGSAVWSVPRLADGRIDVEALESACVAARRVAKPGSVYSYGNVGAWLVAGALERVHGRSYSELLGALLANVGTSDLAASVHDDACPASGGDAEISMRALVNLLRLHLGDDLGNPCLKDAAAALRSTRARHFPVQGWSTEKAVTPGWKYYGDGWYGHSGQLADWSATIRLNPDKQVGLALASDQAHQFLLLARIFGAALPDVRDLVVPRILDPDKVDPAVLDACEGVYESAAYAVAVARGEGTTLNASVRSRASQPTGPDRVVTLRPAGPRLFLVTPAVPDVLPLAQFLGGSGRPEYLWNGRQVFRRSSDSDRLEDVEES